MNTIAMVIVALTASISAQQSGTLAQPREALQDSQRSTSDVKLVIPELFPPSRVGAEQRGGALEAQRGHASELRSARTVYIIVCENTGSMTKRRPDLESMLGDQLRTAFGLSMGDGKAPVDVVISVTISRAETSEVPDRYDVAGMVARTTNSLGKLHILYDYAESDQPAPAVLKGFFDALMAATNREPIDLQKLP